jgi:hypothetical protein
MFFSPRRHSRSADRPRADRVVARRLQFEAIEDRLMLSAVATPLRSLLPRLDFPSLEIIKYAPMRGTDSSAIQSGGDGRWAGPGTSDDGGFITFNLSPSAPATNEVRSNDNGTAASSASDLTTFSSPIVAAPELGGMTPRRVPMDFQGGEGGPIALGGDVSPSGRGLQQFATLPSRAVINDDAAAMASTKAPKLSEALVDQTLLGDWARATNFEVAGGGPSPANSAPNADSELMPMLLPEGDVIGKPKSGNSLESKQHEELRTYDGHDDATVPNTQLHNQANVAMSRSSNNILVSTIQPAEKIEFPWHRSNGFDRSLQAAIGLSSSAVTEPIPLEPAGAINVATRNGSAERTQRDLRVAGASVARDAMFRRAVAIVPLLVFLVVDCFALRETLERRHGDLAELTPEPPGPNRPKHS